jgi:hypothetical protein
MPFEDCFYGSSHTQRSNVQHDFSPETGNVTCNQSWPNHGIHLSRLQIGRYVLGVLVG